MPEETVETVEVTQADPASGNLEFADFKKARAGETLNIPKEAPKEVETEIKGEEETPVKAEETKAEEGKAEEARPDKRTKDPKPRIEKLTREKYELEDRVAKQEEELTRLRAGRAEPVKTEPGEPIFDAAYLAKAGKEGKTYEEALQQFTREHGKWAYQQEKAAETKKSAEEAFNTHTKEVFDSYNKRMEAFRATTDIDELVNETSKAGHEIPVSAKLPIIELENGPQVLEYLCKNTDVLDSLKDMSDIRVIAKLGAISEKLLGGGSAKDEKGTKASSKAPEPITPVGTGAGKGEVDPENMSLSDYKKWHARQANA